MSKLSTLKLDDIATIERGRFSPRPRNDPRYYGGDIPFVQTGDVSRAGTYIHEYSQTLNKDGLAVSKLFPKDTILMTIAANVGDVSILDFDSACPDSLVAFTPKEGMYNKWLFHVLSTMKRKFDSLSTQNAQKNLSLEKIKPVKIHVPSYDAQVDMASTFDAWDAAIEKTEALIDAKERQFRWLKSQLLLRNPNAKHWKTKTLGHYIEEKNEKSSVPDLHPCLTSSRRGMFLQDEYFSKQVASKDNTGYKIISRGEFTYRSMSDDCKFVFNKQDIVDKGLISPAYGVFAPNKHMDADFLYYFLNSSVFKRALAGEIQGGTRTALKLNSLKKLDIDIPELPEQQAIANKLNTAKHEIDLLIKLADQYRTQKRGLMQKLLSGELHIKNKESA